MGMSAVQAPVQAKALIIGFKKLVHLVSFGWCVLEQLRYIFFKIFLKVFF
jgi:hypothetical protein